MLFIMRAGHQSSPDTLKHSEDLIIYVVYYVLQPSIAISNLFLSNTCVNKIIAYFDGTAQSNEMISGITTKLLSNHYNFKNNSILFTLLSSFCPQTLLSSFCHQTCLRLKNAKLFSLSITVLIPFAFFFLLSIF